MGDEVRIGSASGTTQVPNSEAVSNKAEKATFLGRAVENLSPLTDTFEVISDQFKRSDTERNLDTHPPLLNEYHKFESGDSADKESYTRVDRTASEYLHFNAEDGGIREGYSRPSLPASDYKQFENGQVRETYSRPAEKPEEPLYSEPEVRGGPPKVVKAVVDLGCKIFKAVNSQRDGVDFHKADGQTRTYNFQRNLGAGNYKNALIAEKVKVTIDDTGKEVQKTTQRVILVMEMNAEEQKSDIDVQSEIKINTRLNEINKEDKKTNQNTLSHVAIAKPITYQGETAFSAKLMKGGALNKHINSLNDTQKDHVASEMCKGIQELHQNGIIHRDIKLDNYLVDEKLNVKISDMGKAFLETDGAHATATFAPTNPPGTGLTTWNKKADVYQLGIALFQLYTGNNNMEQFRAMMAPNLTPQERKDPDKFYAARDEGVALGHWEGTELINPPEKREFILRMLDQDPNNRPNMDEVVKFFEK